MNKKKIRKFAVMLTVVMLLGTLLTGCGSKETSSEKKAVKIAFIGPLTGANAMQGTGARNAFQLAVKQANESGKLPFKLEVVELDDASNPATGASVAQKVVADPGIVAVSGHWNSPVAEATIPIFKAAGMPLLIWGAIGPALTSPGNYPYITRVAPTQAQESEPLVKFVVNELNRKKWAIISDTSSYGKSNTEVWTNELKKYPGTEVVSVDEIQVGQIDFRPILSKLKEQKFDGIYFGGVVMEAALARRQASELGMKDSLLVGISGIIYDNFILTAGADAAEGVISTKPGKEISKMVGGQEFESAYQKAGYKEPYGARGPYAYDSANIIIEALKQVGSDKKALVNAIAKIKYDGLLGTTTFNEIGQTANAATTIYVVQDGKWIDWESSEYKKGTRKLPGTN